MYKFGEINFYEKELKLKEVIKNMDLQQHDPALYACDLNVLKEKYVTWRRYLPRVEVYYAVKCNDDTFVLKTMANLGAGFDCASKNEIKEVLAIGADPERIIFAHPCKPVSHLEYAKEQNITDTTVDTEFEIYKIFKHYPESNLVIRFRSDAESAQSPLGEKFGCDAYNDATALMLLAKSLDLNVIGGSFHVGSGVNTDFHAYHRGITIAANIFKFGKTLGFDMNLLDIGGGFPGSDDEKFKTIAHIINKSLERHFPDDKVKIISEPGRYFVANAYTLICKVLGKRQIRQDDKLDTTMYFLNDGVYGSFSYVLYDYHEVTAYHLLDEDDNGKLPTFKAIVWGPTLDSLDKIIENVYLPNLKRDDWMAFPNMGAYTIPIASPFNGFEVPRIIYFMKQKSV